MQTKRVHQGPRQGTRLSRASLVTLFAGRECDFQSLHSNIPRAQIQVGGFFTIFVQLTSKPIDTVPEVDIQGQYYCFAFVARPDTQGAAYEKHLESEKTEE